MFSSPPPNRTFSSGRKRRGEPCKEIPSKCCAAKRPNWNACRRKSQPCAWWENSCATSPYPTETSPPAAKSCRCRESQVRMQKVRNRRNTPLLFLSLSFSIFVVLDSYRYLSILHKFRFVLIAEC